MLPTPVYSVDGKTQIQNWEMTFPAPQRILIGLFIHSVPTWGTLSKLYHCCPQVGRALSCSQHIFLLVSKGHCSIPMCPHVHLKHLSNRGHCCGAAGRAACISYWNGGSGLGLIHFRSNSLLKAFGKQWEMALALGPLPPMWKTDGAPGSWFSAWCSSSFSGSVESEPQEGKSICLSFSFSTLPSKELK